MGRSGYSDDCDDEYNSANLYQANIERALKGKRGQAFFHDLAAALDAMPEKRLVAEELQTTEGEVCALGCLGKARGVDMRDVDTEDHDKLGKLFGIAPLLAREVMFMNDDDFGYRRDLKTPEDRWQYMREWVNKQLKAAG
jgi:hypothetical protein